MRLVSRMRIQRAIRRVFFAVCLFLLVYAALVTLRGTNHSVADHDVTESKRASSICAGKQEQTNFVYVKMIKCASETLASLFRRFGYHRNLTFVLPFDKRLYIGWPFQLQTDMYRHTDTDDFDLLVDHAVYNRTTMRKLMKPGELSFSEEYETYHDSKG